MELEQRAAALLRALLAVYEPYVKEHPGDFNQDVFRHGNITSARYLIEALEEGRVRLVKTDGWKE